MAAAADAAATAVCVAKQKKQILTFKTENVYAIGTRLVYVICKQLLKEQEQKQTWEGLQICVKCLLTVWLSPSRLESTGLNFQQKTLGQEVPTFLDWVSSRGIALVGKNIVVQWNMITVYMTRT